MQSSSGRLGVCMFLLGVVVPWVLATVVVYVFPVQAQPADLSPEQRLKSLQYELNVCDLSARHARKTLTDELRQAVERAEKAEQALTVAQQELKKHAPPPAKTTE